MGKDRILRTGAGTETGRNGSNSRRWRQHVARVLERLVSDPVARIVCPDAGDYQICDGGAPTAVPQEVARLLIARGLLEVEKPGSFQASAVARAWLKRQAHPERQFAAQHQTIVTGALEDGARVTVNLDESPLAALARRRGGRGEAWLAPHAVMAAERLRRDFEQGRLQPRVTANWSATINMGRRTGDGGMASELTDLALAARLRLDRAIAEVGPELSGVLIDVCCFLKGLETVERERLWPARSAKLVLRLGLEALARHYGLTASASGDPKRRKIRHWGADDYRPGIT